MYESQRKWKQDNKERIAKKRREYYLKNKEEALTYQRNYYILNREDLLAKAKKRSIDFIGHIGVLYRVIKKYAKKWGLPISEWDEFKAWAETDPAYEECHNKWVANLFAEQFTPVIMRHVKKHGFVVGNLQGRLKGEYYWWSEEKAYQDAMAKELESEQRKRNKGTPEWEAKVVKQWKAVQDKRKKK